MNLGTIFHLIQQSTNDYKSLEESYRIRTGDSLVVDPYSSITKYQPSINLTVSIVISAWNAHDTIERCLIAIEQSSFNRRHPGQLQVIVVDDGSTDDTWDILHRIKLGCSFIAVSQEHHTQPLAMNTGISLADGDIIVSCDADMILTAFAIDELLKRHYILGKALLVGFRYDINTSDPQINYQNIKTNLKDLLPKFQLDNRITYHWDGHIYPGWPDNMCRESRNFKDLGLGRKIFLPDGDFWSLPRMVYGALFSMRRNEWEMMDGFEEQFSGWGWSDTFVGAKAIALGCPIIPVYGATGAHVAHHARYWRQHFEGSSNRALYHQFLHRSLKEYPSRYLNRAKNRIRKHLERSEVFQVDYENKFSNINVESLLNDPDSLGDYLFVLGRYDEAIMAFMTAGNPPYNNHRSLVKLGRVFRILRRFSDAISTLKQACAYLPNETAPKTELGLTFASESEFTIARNLIEQASSAGDKLAKYSLCCPAYRFINRGRKYESQGFWSLALQDYEAALIQDKNNRYAVAARSRVLNNLED